MTGPVASSQPATLRLSPRCDAAEVRTAVLEIHRFLAGMGWSTEDLNSIDLALVEAGNNAVRYVKEPGRNRPVIMESVCEPDRVEFRVFDHTPGFEWPQRAELPASESE